MTPSANPAIAAMLSHASVRAFTEEPVSEADVAAVLAAAQACSSSNLQQVTSIIRVTDPAKRARLAELAGNQPYVASAPEFWVFVGDNRRHSLMVPGARLGWTEQLLVAVLDTGIMMQGAMNALEALGLGGVFIGGLRNNVEAVDELLELPPNAFVVNGLAFGHPARRPGVKPRMPSSLVFMENSYRDPDPEVLRGYDEGTLAAYYAARPEGAKQTTWTRELERIVAVERRCFMKGYLQKKGFMLQ
ncbi:MAG: oxygen-insensitive NADPH nitroreductase [Duodenibacillus sp.]|nr:oxygen-insensitive NADPH nitroreductase [Duodenibacillus sp.]